jgi:hypothetical protein
VAAARRRPLAQESALQRCGGLLSAIVLLTAGITKFTAGAWVAVLTVGLFIVVALRIRRHYDLTSAARSLRPTAIDVPKLRLAPRAAASAPAADAKGRESAAGPEDEARAETEETPQEIEHLMIVPMDGLDMASMRALAYAASLQQPVLALHISPTEGEAARFRDYWHTWGDHLPLEVVVSPHRAIVAPMVNYIWSLHRLRPDLTLTVILPEIVVRHWWHRFLHNRTGPRLRRAVRPLPKVVVTTVPFHLPH